MSAADLVRLVTDALFILVFVAAALAALRERRSPQIDAALLFGALALVVAQGELTRLLGIKLPPAVAAISAALVVAIPYLLLRLVDDLVGVPRRVLLAALAAYAAIVVGLLLLGTPLPTWATLAIVLYFVVLQLYGSALLLLETRRSSGVTRRRLEATVLGSVLLALAVLAAGVQIVAPVESLVRILAFGSALAYFVGFAPPTILRRAWREPALREFVAGVAAISPATETAGIVARLEERAGMATGAALVSIGLWDEEAGALRFRSGFELRAGEGISGRAFAEGRPIISMDPWRDEPAHVQRYEELGIRAIVAAPMTARGQRIGTLAAYARRAPLFSEDDLGSTQLLATQSALVIDSARAYAALSESNRVLADATRAKTEFLANMSHELRTPLNAVLGFADLLAEQLGPSLSPPQQRYLRNIKDAGGHLLELINEVLDLSKVEAGRVQLRPETMALVPLVEPVITAARVDAEARGVAFEMAVDASATVRLDAGRLRQILYNLLSNAVKFTEPGGTARLHAELRGQDLHLEVADTGIGIPADRWDRVFGTFERLHEGRSEASGTGLGLALTKKLVELHGGTIEFESQEGRGTTFRVRIPHVAAAPITGPRILVVEDDTRDAELIAALAAGEGLRSEIVGSAAAAREALRRDPPTAVVLDLRLPDERGERVLEALKADPATRRVPVIVVTVEDDEGRSRPLGADDHLTKPIDQGRLASWLRRLVDASHVGADAERNAR